MVSAAAVPALYHGDVVHVRHGDAGNRFRHPLYTWLVDLDALPRLPWWLRPLARFDARDHLGDPRRGIRQNLERWLTLRGVELDGGRVLMLAHARVLGHVFNPITVYWCHRLDGSVRCVVAEVHNTYGERHAYLLHPDESGRAEVGKEFYVSPFLPEHGRYEMRVRPPGERLHLRIRLRDEHRPLLTAVFTGVREPATTRAVVRAALRRPLVPQRVSALIRKHGISLWLRGFRIVPRRPHLHQEGIR
ncbi:DUF1365 domain-containing protein [Saccharopolyspora sp. NPDC047091]|uniref:DUF1365 domain-containing protein n=1 Tax=Saccharopolyspora sp. NPDC047091 TaxID=3155924 RepID=UPI0033F7CC3C